MTRSSFAPNLADSAGASEDTARRASADGRSKMASGLQVEFPRNPPPSFVNVIVNVNEQPTSGRAFSLVELLAVVGIIALLSVAAVPVMRGLGGGQSSRATAQILVSALEQARTAAILSGTNAYLAIPATNFSETNYHRAAYAVIRPSVDLDGNDRDDFQTNAPHPGWILLSKWERLPGDLVFSANRINTLTNLSVSNLAVPRNPRWEGNLRGIGFTPSGGLMDGTGTNGLWFASAAVTNRPNGNFPSDQIEISRFSGRVRYAGILTNSTNF